MKACWSVTTEMRFVCGPAELKRSMSCAAMAADWKSRGSLAGRNWKCSRTNTDNCYVIDSIKGGEVSPSIVVNLEGGRNECTRRINRACCDNDGIVVNSGVRGDHLSLGNLNEVSVEY